MRDLQRCGDDDIFAISGHNSVRNLRVMNTFHKIKFSALVQTNTVAQF